MNLIKYFAAIVVVAIISSCGFFKQDFNLNGTAEGINKGTVILTDHSGNTIAGVNISDGKFEIKNHYLQRPDYCMLTIAADGDRPHEYTIYLENADYHVRFKKDGRYPGINSTSKTQTELSNYYAILASIAQKNLQEKTRLAALLNTGSSIPQPEHDKLEKELETIEAEKPLLKLYALEKFIDKYPKNKTAAYLMGEMTYDRDPNAYYAVYKKFNTYNKESPKGEAIGETLKNLIRLAPGALAPQLSGLTPDGKKVDLRKIKAKLILVEFWRAGNHVSRVNHQIMIAAPFDGTGHVLAIVSVSCDTKRDWWLTSAKDDKLTWTQVSDLKGDDSPNAANWALSSIPTYYLLDGTGHILFGDISFSSIRPTVTQLLARPD